MARVYLDSPEQYLSINYRKNLNNIKKNYMDNDQDFFMLIVGDGTGLGLGKSTLMHATLAYMDVLLHGEKNRRFTTDNLFFDTDDYRLSKSRLKPLDCFGWDEPDSFLSTDGSTRKSRKLKLDLIHIRDQRHFMMVCADNIFTVGPWLRPNNASRINAILRIIKKGVVYAYTFKTGSMLNIRVDQRTRKITWPPADLIFFFKPIPKSTEWWKDYKRRKDKHKGKSCLDEKVSRLSLKREEKIRKSFTMSDIAEIAGVSKVTAFKWKNMGVFPKSGVYVDYNGTVRVTEKAYKSGMKKVFRMKQKDGRRKL